MSKKLKYYFIGISFVSMITCINIIPLRTSYGDNTVEKESSVSYKKVIDNRGLKENIYEDINTNNNEENQNVSIETMSYSITNNNIEEPVAGITLSLLNIVDDKEVKELPDNNDVNYKWTTNRVNLREEASTKSDIILTLDKRVKVEMISSSNKWTKVKYENKDGYIYSKYLRNSELPSLDFTDEEIDLLAKIVWLESRGESDKGCAAVITVILNRILHMEFSDTLYEVLSKKSEFSSWKLLNTAKPTEREREIIEETLRGDWDGILTEDHVYFSTKPRNSNGTVKIGNHFFCEY